MNEKERLSPKELMEKLNPGHQVFFDDMSPKAAAFRILDMISDKSPYRLFTASDVVMISDLAVLWSTIEELETIRVRAEKEIAEIKEFQDELTKRPLTPEVRATYFQQSYLLQLIDNIIKGGPIQ